MRLIIIYPLILAFAMEMLGGTSPQLDSGTSDGSNPSWDFDGDIELSGSYTANTHWADEHKHSTYLHTELSLEPKFQKNNWHFKSKLDISLTHQKADDQPWKRPSDHLEVVGKLVYDMTNWMDAAFHADLKTQTLPGHNYYGDWMNEHYTSNIMAPGAMVYGLGMDIKPDGSGLAMVLSPISLKSTYVLDNSLDETLFDLDSGSTRRTESGTFASLEYETEILENVKIDLRGTIFMDYAMQEKVDYSLKTEIEYQPVRFLTLGWDLRILYDEGMKVEVYRDINEDGRYDDFPSVESVTQVSSKFKLGLKFDF